MSLDSLLAFVERMPQNDQCSLLVVQAKTKSISYIQRFITFSSFIQIYFDFVVQRFSSANILNLLHQQEFQFTILEMPQSRLFLFMNLFLLLP